MTAVPGLEPSPRPPAGVSQLFLRIFAFLTLITVVTVVQANYFVDNSTGSFDNLIRFLLSKAVYYWYFLGVAVVVEHLSRTIPFERSSIIRWGATHVAVMTVSFVLHQLLTLGIDRLVWGSPPKGSLLYLLFNNPALWMEILGYGAFLLIFSVRVLRKKFYEEELRCSALEAQLMEARFDELRARLHPAFLFGTLDSMSNLIQAGRHKMANTLLGLFSDFLRTAVYDRGQEERTIQSELDFLHQYLAIKKIAMGDALAVREDIDSEVLPAMIPGFMLQPLAEELLHASSDPPGLPLELDLSIRSTPPMITVAMSGTCPRGGRNVETPPLRDIRARLEDLHGARCRIDAGHIDDRLQITCTLPMGGDDPSPVVDGVTREARA